jgi:hypothetical protein
MLRENDLTFSQILESLSMDSGHLSYHLDSLGDLIARSQDGKYGLSSFGLAAVKLMSRVEEHDSSSATPKRMNIMNLTATIFSAALVIALLATSVYALGLTTQTSGDLVSVHAIPVSIAANEIFSYDVTLACRCNQTTTEPYGISTTIPDPDDTIAKWTEYTLTFDMEINSSYDISLVIHDPDGKIISPAQFREAGDPSGFPISFGSGSYFTKPGTYKIQIENEKVNSFYASMALHVAYILSQRPLFGCALAGLIVALLYPTALLLSWFWVKKSKATAKAVSPTYFNA